MRRASKVFAIEDRAIASPFVEEIWRTSSEPVEAFISVAASHSQFVFTKQHGRTFVTVRGPETKATIVPIPQDAEFFGVQFRPGVYMPNVPCRQLVDRSVTLPETSRQSFWLITTMMEIPVYDNVDVFVKQLVRKGLLVRDPLIGAVLDGGVQGISSRTVQRRFLNATGLTQSTFKQIQRAFRAAELLDSGCSILETVERADYADQAHMTRSLKRFVGETPSQIVRQRTCR